ncbi:hypothetical protein BC831DRAFT_455776, partial [Entophlyctis helioformis]
MLSPRQLVRLLPLLLLQALLLVCAFMPPASLACCRVPACMQLTMAANHDILLSWTHTACDSPQARPVCVSCAGREPAAHKHNHRSGI